jgi:hypothetical protein
LLAKGGDPAKHIKLERIAATVTASNSFKAVADEWLEKAEREGRAAMTMKKLRWLLNFINWLRIPMIARSHSEMMARSVPR